VLKEVGVLLSWHLNVNNNSSGSQTADGSWVQVLSSKAALGTGVALGHQSLTLNPGPYPNKSYNHTYLLTVYYKPLASILVFVVLACNVTLLHSSPTLASRCPGPGQKESSNTADAALTQVS